MANRWIILAVGFLLAPMAPAQGRSDYRIERRSGLDLVRESEELQLTKEPKVQSKASLRERSYALGFGRFDSHFLSVETDGTQTRYDLSDATPMFRLSYAQLPWRFEGQLGWQVNFAYGFQDTKVASEKVTLHMLPISAEFLYRARITETQLWAPQLSAGGGNMFYYQRGGPGLNTSGSDWFGLLSASLWFGVGDWLKPGAMAPVDLTLSFSRVVSGHSRTADWAGQYWFMNVGVGL